MTNDCHVTVLTSSSLLQKHKFSERKIAPFRSVPFVLRSESSPDQFVVSTEYMDNKFSLTDVAFFHGMRSLVHGADYAAQYQSSK